MQNLSRRAALVGASAAAGSVANVAAITAAMSAGPDPILAAIERHRQLDAAHAAACELDDDDAKDAACDAAFEALADLVAITPTTLAGCAAMLRYCHHVTHLEYGESEGKLFGGYTRVEPVAADLLLRLADRLETAA